MADAENTSHNKPIASILRYFFELHREEFLDLCQKRLYKNYLAIQDMAIEGICKLAEAPEDTFYGDVGSPLKTPTSSDGGSRWPD